jgi:formylglycine-generating enzyme required for sulfatase activity/energy-coupling factor transporter ATP-binding protein EcfA2
MSSNQSDPATQLATLRILRATVTDPAQLAALDTLIAQLQAATARSHIQTIGDAAHVDVAVAGDVHGDVHTGGMHYQAQTQFFFQAVGVVAPHPNQQELLVSYLDTLARRCDRLRLTGVVDWERKRGKAPSFTLSQVYVTLAATTSVVVEEATTKSAFKTVLKAGDPDQVSPVEARTLVERARADVPVDRLPKKGRGVRYVLERPLLLTMAVSQRRRVVLLGGPGSGKSTFLRHLAVALAHFDRQESELPGWEAGALLPIYASLGGFAAWVQAQRRRFDGNSLWDYLLSASEHATLAGLGTELGRAFRAGQLLLLLDGLDEVADPALRAQTAAAVADLGLDSRSYLVVTCRMRSFVGDIAAPLAEWGTPIELAPFTLGQIQHFIRGWYQQGITPGVLDHAGATRRANALIDRVRVLPALRDLAQTPLLLTIITILHYYEGKLPEDRADLYEDLVQLLLTRWTQQRREAGAQPSVLERLKAGGVLGGLKEFHLRNVLEELAYRAHQSAQSPDGRGLLERGAVREALITLFKEFELGPGPANEKAELVLEYLEQESGLLLHEGGDRYGLPHLTYEEYLAGCYLAKQKDKPDFRALAYQHWQADPTRWREVIFLALGRMVRGDDRDTAAAWLHYLLAPEHGSRKRGETERATAAFFAVECLADLGGKPALIGAATLALGELWAALGAAMVRVIEGTALPVAERVRFARDLAPLDDPRPGVCTLPPPMVRILGGTFTIGEIQMAATRTREASRHWYVNTANGGAVTVATFELARYPVTYAQYKLFEENDGYNAKREWWNPSDQHWLSSRNFQESRVRRNDRVGQMHPNHPVVGVTWYEAMAFCRWLTQVLNDNHIYALPTEAEWEYAARGYERRPYPWGVEEPDDERANFNEIYHGTTAVGCFAQGATPEGILDLAGNVWEWTRSEYRPYPYNPSDGREALISTAQIKVTRRGGAWGYDAPSLRASNRGFGDVFSVESDVGFRLARYLKM